MEDPHTSLPVGTILKGGEYTILGKIGEGGFSITYVARQNDLNRKVCIKEYFLDGCCFRREGSLRVECKASFIEQFEKYRKAFVHEAEMVASVSHPNVVDVIGVFQENNTAYMVMQFIEGQTLESLVVKRGALPLDEAKNYMSQIAEAVGYIHDCNILHRDIKPGNIMITGDYRAILIDFGSAREFVDDKTQAHTSMLTRGYAPPEQYSTVSRKGRYSDIYSLGATLYYVLTATPPVDAAARMTEPFPEPASLNPAIPAKINNAIIKAMQTNPADRYQDVHSFVSNLWTAENVAGDETQQNSQTQRTLLISQARTVKLDGVQKQREDKTWLWILFAILACLIIVGIVALVRNSGSASQEDTAKQRDEIKVIKEAKQTITANGVSFDMVYVEGGTFTMGCTSEQGSDCFGSEEPAHSVKLSGYYIGETEVTQALWKAVMGSNPSSFNGDNLPVENVSWDDAQAFILELNRNTGRTFRLPTEAEWEYAARGGSKSRGYKYSGSENVGNVAWYWDNVSRTHPVKTRSPNVLGLYDMSGNVWEWCSDWYEDYSSSSRTNPAGPSTGLGRVYRGGSWYNNARHCRVSNRYYGSASHRSHGLGFRLVLVQ
ncbi:MAG: SUMF1/EgtB/PvdO family nonheme iron enzyme [Bacteroidales bacterium]|nr:SUMF1/EgtB/PvdO family nonheme iron enzyme [Bacteroidales bacterium]